MPPPRPYTLVAELSYRCPLHCPYCSNPVDIGGERYRAELETEHWTRVFGEARALGVLQLALTGGEPMVRRDLDELVAAGARGRPVLDARDRGHAPDARARRAPQGGGARPRPGLDPEPRSARRTTGSPASGRSRRRSRPRARRASWGSRSRSTASCTARTSTGSRRSSRSPRSSTRSGSSSRTRSTTGGPSLNQQALMPTREQLERGEEAVQRFRERVGPRITVLWVLPDYFEDLPKPCMGGWGRSAIVVAPNGEALPCQAAATIPGLEFPNVRERSLDWIWHESDAFTRFRGTDWMQEPCRSCPLGRQEEDWGGCRCQALRLDRRRRGDRSRLPVLAAPRHRRRRPRVGADGRVHLPDDASSCRRLNASRRALRPRAPRRSVAARRDGELDEHADAVAARPRADRVAAIVVEQRGAEHVDVRPRPLAGEALEEGRGGDRIPVGPPRGVAQIGDPRVEQAAVAPVQRPRPREVAGGVAGVDDRVAPVRRRWRRRRRRGRPSRPASRRSASRGRRRASRPAPRAYQSASARISRPSASGFVTSTVRPAAVVITSDGRIASGPIMFSQAGRTPRTASGSSSSAIAPSAASTAAPPAMSPFWRTMSDCGLRK